MEFVKIAEYDRLIARANNSDEAQSTMRDLQLKGLVPTYIATKAGAFVSVRSDLEEPLKAAKHQIDESLSPGDDRYAQYIEALEKIAERSKSSSVRS